MKKRFVYLNSKTIFGIKSILFIRQEIIAQIMIVILVKKSYSVVMEID